MRIHYRNTGIVLTDENPDREWAIRLAGIAGRRFAYLSHARFSVRFLV